MKKELISTDRAAQPGGWYSQGFQVGDFVFTAGITGTDPETGKLVGPDDIQAQTHQIMKNMKAILEAAGTDLEHVFKTLVFFADIDQFSIFNETYKQYFPSRIIGRFAAVYKHRTEYQHVFHKADYGKVSKKVIDS